MQQQVAAVKAMPRIIRTLLGLWFLLALLVGVSGLFYSVSAPVVGLVNVVLVTLTLLSIFFVRSLQRWVMDVSLRFLVLYHTIRILAGVGFLVLFQQGDLPDTFALIAGWGDILVGISAIIVAARAIPVSNQARWWMVLAWNIFGLIDILRVLGTALRLGTVAPEQVRAITAFPMSLLPTFIVPLVLVTHFLIFMRLWRIWRTFET